MWSQSHEIPDTPWLPAVMTQSTRRVSDSVTMHSLMRSSLDSSEHVVPVAAMAWVGVDVLDALPHPASAVQRDEGDGGECGADGVSHWFHSFP